jgi:hypothetical protein
MEDAELCPECGAPGYMTSEHIWLPSGAIVQTKDPSHRMVFFEPENIDPLFQGIEKIIGVPIEQIIIDSKRRATRDYISKLVPEQVKEMLRKKELDIRVMQSRQMDLAWIMGSGRLTLLDIRYELDDDDFILERAENPYSIPMLCGDIIGVNEGTLDRDLGCTYVQVSPDVYDFRAFVSTHPEELEDRAQRKVYTDREGDIELEKCSVCGAPKALSTLQWDTEKGTIRNKYTGRRMTLNGETPMQATFEELEEELGETIPQVVVEAQRLFTRTGFYTIEDISSEGTLRTQLALRGMGMLQKLKMDDKGLHVRLDNAVLYLILTGMFQGLFEMATGLESNVEWELFEDGNLEVEVTPKK